MSAPTLPTTVHVVFVFDADENEWQAEYVAESRSEADDHEADILSRVESRTCVMRYQLPPAPKKPESPALSPEQRAERAWEIESAKQKLYSANQGAIFKAGFLAALKEQKP